MVLIIRGPLSYLLIRHQQESPEAGRIRSNLDGLLGYAVNNGKYRAVTYGVAGKMHSMPGTTLNTARKKRASEYLLKH